MKAINSEESFGKSVWLFFLLTFAASWAFWIPLAASGEEVSLAVLVIGAFSPSVFGVIFSYVKGGYEV